MTDGVRWLSPREQDAWRAYLRADQLLHDGLDRQLRRDSGMPHVYYRILVQLSESVGRSRSMTALARAADLSASRLSHAVSSLEARGWVTRCRDTDNGRIVLARLTERGFAALSAAAPGHVREVRRRVFDRLTTEQVDAMVTIAQAVAAADRETP